ncbi:MAG TPA: hypothetical protein PLD88_05900, partial [Candidatus Berkiella sp.]|nr:hypothetical protein [Candidatus Berkiella sp.]
FDNLFHFRNNINKHPIYLNHQWLETWRRKLMLAPQLPSFRDLIITAANTPLKSRMSYVKQIVNEINSITLTG